MAVPEKPMDDVQFTAVERISSRQNPIVKRFRAAAGSASDGLLLDGAHLLEEALAADLRVEVVAIRDDLANGPAGALVRRAESRGARVFTVSDTVLTAMSPVRRPSGMVALARRRPVTLDDALQRAPQFVLMLADIQDPGNVGAIVRAADGCGATGIVTSEATADPFGWKALRGSMGSAFRLPVASRQKLDEAAREAKARRLRLYAAVPRGGTLLPQCDLRSASAVLLGGEGAGLDGTLMDLADQHMTIPMRRPVESLNVATAAALIAYEAMRQRQETAP